MPFRRTRRTFLAQLSISVGVSGCLGSGTGNPAASVVARLFNNAYDTFRKARSSLQDAKAALDNEDWKEAFNLFAQAQSQFKRAERDFQNAVMGARRTGCGAIREDARNMSRKCHIYAEACRNWKEAAALYERGDNEEAERFRVDGNEAYEQATTLPIVNEKDQKAPQCASDTREGSPVR